MEKKLKEDSVNHTSKYPPIQPVTIMPIATDTLADPNTFPTTVGIVEKNPPLDAPLTMTNATRGPRVLDTGHNTNILPAHVANARKSVFNGPILSLRSPHPIRPTAEEKLKPATRAAPELEERPREAP